MTSTLMFKHFVKNPHGIYSAIVGCYATEKGCYGDFMRYQ